MRTIILQALILGTAALVVSGQQAISQELKHASPTSQNAVAKHPPDVLMREFWACDYAATAHGILDREAMTFCVMVSEQLKLAKFDGDLAAMLSWWREHKGQEHEALAARFGAASQH